MGVAEPGTRARILPRQTVLARDGVELCTDVFLPEATAPRPTVVVRTPYGRNRPFLMLLGSRLSARGLCVVTQDCRGRYQSQGEFDLALEENDTRDTLEWLAEQEWSAPRTALLGVSISSYPNFLTAAAGAPPGVEIATVVSLMGVLDTHSLFYRGGALVLHWALPWITLMSPAHNGRSSWLELPWADVLRRRPLADLAAATGGYRELWDYVVRHPARDGWISAFERLRGLRVPALFLCGWHDFLLSHTLRGFREATAGGGGTPHRLVLGDWNHQSLFYSFRKARDEEEAATHLDLMVLLADWLERWLEPAPDAGGGPRVYVQVLGAERWIAADRFPPREAEVACWYLGRRDGEGRLSTEPPATLGSDAFVYDPDDPVPTVGGAVWQFDPIGLVPGLLDQSEVEARPDVLLYTSEPLPHDLVVAGPVAVELWAASSARDTDFTAKLVDVDAAGVPRIVQDGIQRARFRDGPDAERFLEPQRPERFRIDLDAVAYRFAAGHRLRLEVSSSNFPKFDRHPNTAGPLHEATGASLGQQSVFHGGGAASCLRLPVLPPAALDRLRFEPGGEEAG